MTRSSPWDAIKKPDLDINVRLVSTAGHSRLFWGKDTSGKHLFILELDGDYAEALRDARISLNGVDVDLRSLDSSKKQGLVLKLERGVDKDIFQSLCESLIEKLKSIDTDDEAFHIALAHIARWKAFLAGHRRKLLSTEEVQGLFAELTFFRMLQEKRSDEIEIADSWCGPLASNQDFNIGDSAVEVKSISGMDRSRVKISSEDQLESTMKNLFLVAFHLISNSDSDRALSLNRLVGITLESLTNADALEVMQQKLAAYGYVSIPDYDTPRFVVSDTQAYRVEEEFPRIARSLLPRGISKVKYQIELESITSFQCDLQAIWEC